MVGSSLILSSRSLKYIAVSKKRPFFVFAPHMDRNPRPRMESSGNTSVATMPFSAGYDFSISNAAGTNSYDHCMRLRCYDFGEGEFGASGRLVLRANSAPSRCRSFLGSIPQPSCFPSYVFSCSCWIRERPKLSDVV